MAISYFRYMAVYIRKLHHQWKTHKDPMYAEDRNIANLIKLTHSIEKGLSLSEPRLGFGHEKQQRMMDLINALSDSDSAFALEVASMALGTLKAYIMYHESIGYTDEFISKMKMFCQDQSNLHPISGGTLILKKREFEWKSSDVEAFIRSRHSIRDFAEDEVDEDKLQKAIEIAMSAPSACNRQASRVWAVNNQHADCLRDWMSGVGGFVSSVKEFLIITGKTSMYTPEEEYQYIVSASIFTGYLSLALHSLGIGSCICQRVPTWNKKWERIRKSLGIPGDEQVVCIMCVGNMKEECAVPVSHRFNTSTIYRRVVPDSK